MPSLGTHAGPYLVDVEVRGCGAADESVLLSQELSQADVEGSLDVPDRLPVLGPLPTALHVANHCERGTSKYHYECVGKTTARETGGGKSRHL